MKIATIVKLSPGVCWSSSAFSQLSDCQIVTGMKIISWSSSSFSQLSQIAFNVFGFIERNLISTPAAHHKLPCFLLFCSFSKNFNIFLFLHFSKNFNIFLSQLSLLFSSRLDQKKMTTAQNLSWLLTNFAKMIALLPQWDMCAVLSTILTFLIFYPSISIFQCPKHTPVRHRGWAKSFSMF